MRPLRLAFFGASVVSDWDNPAATTTRAVLRALGRQGHEAVFFEERGNRPTVDLLRARGGGPLRSFATRYPDLRYRTYDLPTGMERTVWFGRELSVVDAVIVQDTASPEVVATVATLAAPHLVRLAQLTAQGPPPFRGDHLLAPIGTDVADTVEFGPAVEPLEASAATPAVPLVVVAYGRPATAHAVAELLGAHRPLLVAVGNVEGAGWSPVPEVDLPDIYAAARVAVVVGHGASPAGAARLLLPLAAGCRVVAVAPEQPFLSLSPPAVAEVAVEDAPRAVARALDQDPAPRPSLPAIFDADLHAGRLIETVHTTLVARSS